MALPIQVYLASASPRRRELLTQIGVRFSVVAVECEEKVALGETAEAYVRRVALEKAQAGWRKVRPSDVPVLGADTEVILDGRVLGKPRDKAQGIAMLASLAGRTHTVLSAVALVGDGLEVVVVQENSVSLRAMTEAELSAYWDTQEPVDKAGGYAVQGLAAVFIERLEGSYSGVMGLPLFETAKLLSEFGVHVI